LDAGNYFFDLGYHWNQNSPFMVSMKNACKPKMIEKFLYKLVNFPREWDNFPISWLWLKYKMWEFVAAIQGMCESLLRNLHFPYALCLKHITL
jgi:hypothetical protein